MPIPPSTRPVPLPRAIAWRPGQATSITFDLLRLDVAAASFAEPVTLRLSVPSEPPPVPEHITMPFVFRLEALSATGQAIRQLSQPVRFNLDFATLSPGDWGQTFVNLYYFDEARQEWVVVPAKTDMASRQIVADVSHFTDFGFGGDANQQPSTPSNLEGFTVDLCTGSARVSIDLKVPPGTAGLAPQLRLRYESGAIDKMNAHWIPDGNNTGNENTRTRLQASPVGLGWSLDLGSIARFNPPRYGDPWDFYLVLNGRTHKLVYVDGTTYRTKQDEYMRVRKLANAPNNSEYHEYWLVETKDGTQYRYGYNANAELIAGKWNFGGTKIAYHWNLDRITDRHGNTIEIDYDKVTVQTNNDPNESYDQAAYPLHINYTSNPGQSFAANRQITFVYSARTDHTTHSMYTYTQYYWKKKLDRVEMRVGGDLARSYEFGYDYQTPYWHLKESLNQVSGLSKLVLTSITEKDASGTALPTTTFTYYSGQIPGSDPAEYYKLQMHEAVNGYGGKVSYVHEGHGLDGESKLMRRYRVSEKRVESGVGAVGGVESTIVLSYSYGTAYNCPYTYDYRGHGEVTVTDAAGHYEKSYFYTRDGINGKSAEDVEKLQSRRYKFERWASSGAAASFTEETGHSLAITQSGTNWAVFVKVDAVRQYQGNVSRKTRYEYDDYGNVMRTKQYDAADAADEGWLRNTRRWYVPSVNSSHYIVGKLAKETVYKPGSGEAEGDWVRSTHHCYDGSYHWNTAIGSGLNGGDQSYRGRLTAVRQMRDGSTCVDVTYGYGCEKLSRVCLE